MKSIKKVLLIFIMIISIFGITNVKALGKDIKVTGASVKDKSGTITVIDPVLTDNGVTSNITFNKVGDFVTFEFEIKNNESEKYKIESIKDNNTNDNIKIEYSFSKEYISSGNTGKVTVKLSYKNKLVNQEKINLNNLAINMTLLNEEGNSSETIINNPTTGDSILHYLVLLIISVTGIIFILKKKRYKGVKVGSVLLLLGIVMLPFVALAQEKYEINLKFNDIEVKGEFEKYNITINPGNGSKPITREVTYGQPIGDLPDVSKEGYDFDKWVDGKGNKVTKETIITGPIEIEAKYNAIKYDITYNLNGGKLSTGKTNPSKYTIENDAITLNNPSKDGYTFTGWTGTGIDTKTTSVTIEAGSTGNREYTANYSANENTPYKVIHRYKNLNETYTEEEVTECGETDKKIDAPIKSKKGFVNPSVQKVTVKADGTSKVTYTYEREKYNFSISDRTYIDNSSTDDGKYPYETEIKVKAIERDGYDFAWSDGKTELERTFKIDENTTLTPVYTAKTNIPYKVIHQKQKITLDGYEIADTQNLTGTTDSEITPAVNTYEGFTSPQAQKVTIKGDGSTVVTYNYDRIMYDFSTNNNENVTSTKEDGRYPYGTEITLTAKEKQGYTFSKWSNNETTNPLTITLDSDLTIEPVYTSDGYTVTFNSNGGGNVNSITVDAGETIQSFTTPTAPSGKIFDGWYTDLESGSKVNTPYTPEGNITLYAHWNNNSFPEVFSEPGECTFNGSNGVLTGDNCSYANGTNKYIDTGINLYNSENHDKDYEIGFTIVSYNPSEQVKQATFMNTKLEGNNYPGLVFRRRDNYDNLDFSSRKTSSTNERKFLDYTDGMKVKIYRITNEETGIQEIFYSINDEEKIKINDLSQFNPEFDLSVWFGAAPTNASATAAQRILVNTTLKDMYIKLGTYYESSSTDKYKVTYNANGGSVSPTSKTINIGDQIGTLPTPTPPTNKTFDGWYTELTGGVKVTSSYVPNNNIIIYARYINDISGATISPSSISIINGNNQTITVSNVGEEYTFRSNNTNVATVDSTGKVTGTGVGTTTITITGSTSGKTRTINVTVEPSSYTVTLNANGGSVNPTSITVNNGDSVGTLPEPTPPTNKTFDGWYKELTGGIEVTSSYVPNSDVTIYARYTDQTFTVSFDTDGGSTVADQTITYGEKATRPTTDPTKTGYTFDNWYTDDTYTTVFDFNNIVITGDTSIYAKFIDPVAIFDTGSTVNIKMKKLSNQSSYENIYSIDKKITNIQKSTNPVDISQMTDDNIVSSSSSLVPIYMWFDNGTIYWWSEDNEPSLNEDSSSMFMYLNVLTNLDVSNFDTSNVTNMGGMFANCRNLSSLVLGNNFNTSKVTNMNGMFYYCYKLTTLDLSSFDTSKVTSMNSMFYYCMNLLTLNLGSNFDTKNVTDMSSMFYHCELLNSLDVSEFETSKVTSMSGMFAGCSSLTELDVSEFKTSNVTNMGGMFNSCSSLESLDLSSFDTSNVTYMGSMFENCNNLLDLDLGNIFDTTKVTNMQYMFKNCNGLTIINLGTKFNTENVTNMDEMFSKCNNLITIYVPTSFVITNVKNRYRIFYDDVNLRGGQGTTYVSSGGIDYAHIDGGTSNPGYFTDIVDLNN